MRINLFNIDIKDRNSFGIGVKADRLICYDSVEDLKQIIVEGILDNTKWNVLSGGNNILFTQDYHGVLLHPTSKQIKLVGKDASHAIVYAQAGVEWDDLVAWCVERNFWGIENLSYIPGYVGAAPVQNIGAYGVEAKDAIESVEMIALHEAKQITLSAAHCDFGYRDSVFKRTLKGKVIITGVTFKLKLTPEPRLGYGDLHKMVESKGGATIDNIRQSVIEIRKAKLPDPAVTGNAGSFFKNPVVSIDKAEQLRKEYSDIPLYEVADGFKVAAGWLIDKAGWKGKNLGKVGVHPAQALVLINLGGASGKEVIDLARKICDDILKKFDIEIETEVNIW